MSRHALKALNRSRKAESRRKAEEAITMEIQGKSRREVADALHVTQNAVSKLKTRYLAERQTEMLEEDLGELESLRDEVVSRRRAGKPLTLGCVDRLIKLLELRVRLRGTAAPTKSVHAHVSADVDPAKLVGYRKFVYETRGLTLSQVDEVYAFARTLVRVVETPKGPPASSPLWDAVEPAQLTEGRRP